MDDVGGFRRRLLRDRSARGPGDGPAAAAVARDGLGGVGTGGYRPNRRWGQRYRRLLRCRSPGIRPTHLTRTATATPATWHRHHAERGVRAGSPTPWVSRARGDHRHLLLGIVGRRPPGDPVAAVRRMRDGVGRRRYGRVRRRASTSASAALARCSRTARCKPFAAAADGFGCREGAGMLVLTTLSTPARYGSRCWRSSAAPRIGQDGASDGLSAPERGQRNERVIRARADRRRTVARRTSTSSRRTAPAPRSAIRSRCGRCRPPTVRRTTRRGRCSSARSSRTSGTRSRRPEWPE